MIYLDNSATTRPFAEVITAVEQSLRTHFFNPSSSYGPAVEVSHMVEGARALLAQALGATPNEIIYTSGATEANNMALFGIQNTRRERGRIITTKVEHPSVFEVYQKLQSLGYDTVYLDVTDTGSVRLDQLEAALTQNTAMVSIMHVNNETGAINDINMAGAIIRRRAPQAVFHVDGVQAFCKLPFSKYACDMYSISGHKFHATKGVGALYVRQGVPFAGGLIGGGQERQLRSGTTNTPGILGMNAALSVYRRNQAVFLQDMRENKLRLANALATIPDVLFNGPAPAEGAPHILNASFIGVQGEVLLNALSELGVLVSTGSACSAHKKGKNRILCAMGVSGKRQEGAIRFSLSPENTTTEMDQAAQIIRDQVTQLRRFQKR